MNFQLNTQSLKPLSQSIPSVSADWSYKDYLGTVKVRWDIGRNNYSVAPGLYKIGNPNSESDVFVSANYKLSFDILRKNLKGLNAWILVIDTKGVNVWCAAGKGTFSTENIFKEVKKHFARSNSKAQEINCTPIRCSGSCCTSCQRTDWL
jgi:hypothetical protein